MALRDPLPMGLGSMLTGGGGPKFNPMQVNQVFNECLHKEFRYQGPVQRRAYRFSLPGLNSGMVAKKANLRTKEAVREQLSKSCNSPRMIRDLQAELGCKESITPMATPPATTKASTLCYKNVKQHLKSDKLGTGDAESRDIRTTLRLQKMMPPERHRLPETMAQEVGWLVNGYAPRRGGPNSGLGGRSMSQPSVRSGSGGFESEGQGEAVVSLLAAPKEAQEKPRFFWKPRRPCPETEYVRLYYETLQSNPFSNQGMFPDGKEKTG